MLKYVLLCVISYLVGSIPFGYLYTKYFAGIDVRNFGSHSTGTTNVLRAGDKKLAVLTLFSDAFKGTLMGYMSLKYPTIAGLIISLLCIIGHVFPVWLNFKGGKGAATAAGTFLALSPLTTLMSAVVWGITAKITKKSSVASFVFCVSFIIITAIRFFLGAPALPILIYSIIVFLFLLFTHRDNIKRILKREELSV